MNLSRYRKAISATTASVVGLLILIAGGAPPDSLPEYVGAASILLSGFFAYLFPND